MEDRKFRERTLWLDLKIVILAICCVLGYVSHMVLRFPRDADKVGICLAIYVVLMVFNYWIESYKEQGAFYISKSHGMAKFKDWQAMKFASEVVIAEDNLSADYEI